MMNKQADCLLFSMFAAFVPHDAKLCYADAGDGMEKSALLLEQEYSTYEGLCTRYGTLIADQLWKEILACRRRVRMHCGLILPDDHLAMTPYVLVRRLRTGALLQQCIYHYCVAGSAFALPMQVTAQLEGFGIGEQSALLRQVLHAAAPDLILILFALRHLRPPYDEKMCALWCGQLLSRAPMKTALEEQLARLNSPAEADLTPAFLAFLDVLELNFKECLLLLNRDSCEWLRLCEEELLHRFPQFSRQQISFFVSHRTPGCYYPIQEYVRHAQVCYETARQAMEQFTACHWYYRRKVGKRFLYSVSGPAGEVDL